MEQQFLYISKDTFALSKLNAKYSDTTALGLNVFGPLAAFIYVSELEFMSLPPDKELKIHIPYIPLQN